MSYACVHSIVLARMLKGQLTCQLTPIHSTCKDALGWLSCWGHIQTLRHPFQKLCVVFTMEQVLLQQVVQPRDSN